MRGSPEPVPGRGSWARKVPGFRVGDSPRRQEYGGAQEDQEHFDKHLARDRSNHLCGGRCELSCSTKVSPLAAPSAEWLCWAPTFTPPTRARLAPPRPRWKSPTTSSLRLQGVEGAVCEGCRRRRSGGEPCRLGAPLPSAFTTAAQPDCQGRGCW